MHNLLCSDYTLQHILNSVLMYLKCPHTYGGKVCAESSLIGLEPERGQFGGGIEYEGLATGSDDLSHHGHQEARLAEQSGADNRVDGAQVPNDGTCDVEQST